MRNLVIEIVKKKLCKIKFLDVWKYSITGIIIIIAILKSVRFIKVDHDKILFELVIGRIVTITMRGTDSSIIKRSHDTLCR